LNHFSSKLNEEEILNNEVHLKNGITRVVNGIEGKPFFHQAAGSYMIDLKEPSPSSRPSRDP
jgi:hypothetical protein